MKRYEYMARRNLTERQLNDRGQVGWELICVDNYVFYFKRKVQ